MRAILKLTRWYEYVPFTIPLTLLGGLMAYRFAEAVELDIRLLYVLLANCLAVAYAFMINDIEDAKDDLANPVRAARNAISMGELSARAAWLISLGIALLATFFYALAGRNALIVGVAIIVLGHLYSWKPIRLKAMPVADIVSHVLMLSALLLLSAYLIYDSSPAEVWLLIAAVTLISAYGQLYNQLRDFDEDQAAGIRNTASLLGKSLTKNVGYLCAAIGAICLLLTILNNAFPLWLAGVILLSLPLVKLVAKGKDMRGDVASDAVGDVQVQFLLVANIVLIVWLIYVLINP